MVTPEQIREGESITNPDWKKQADRIVAQGVGKSWDDFGVFRLRIGDSDLLTDKEFCQDGRVTLALMEKCIGMTISEMEIDSGYGRGWEVYNCFSINTHFGGGDHCYKFTKANNESLPYAINEACLDALETT